MKLNVSTLLASLLLACSAAAQAVVVYDNGPPDLMGGNEMTNWIQAEDFTLASTTTITDVHFWSLEAPGGYSGSIQYAFYSDAGGSPNLGAPVAGFAAGAALTRTATGNTFFGLDEYYYSFDVAPFVALGGTTYWLGLHNGPIGNDVRAEVYWETTALNATITGNEDFLPPAGDAWSNNLAEHAFQLTAVPEPSTIALFALGLVGMAFARRRQ